MSFPQVYASQLTKMGSRVSVSNIWGTSNTWTSNYGEKYATTFIPNAIEKSYITKINYSYACPVRGMSEIEMPESSAGAAPASPRKYPPNSRFQS